MTLKVDQEGAKLIQYLCNAALRHGGLGNFDAVGDVLNSMVLEDSKEDKKEKDIINEKSN